MVRYENAAIPAGLTWSTPFTRWQGPLAGVSSLDLAADVTARALTARSLDPAELTGLVLGWTIPQPDIFYGAPTLAARIGAPGVTGPMVSQACATSVAALHSAASSVQGAADVHAVVATDRTSNGPQLVYPAPSRQGGAPLLANWVADSFARDPWAGTGMLAAGDTVAAEMGASRAELDELAVLRSEQYAKALADDRGVQRRQQGGRVQLEHGTVIFDGTANVNLRGKDVEVSLFERADVIGANFGHFGDLFDRKALRLARGAELREIVAGMIVDMIQLAGRARRGGTDMTLHLTDYAFHEDSWQSDLANILRRIYSKWSAGQRRKLNAIYRAALAAFLAYAGIDTSDD